MILSDAPCSHRVDWYFDWDDSNGYPEVVFLPCSHRAWNEYTIDVCDSDGLLTMAPLAAQRFKVLLEAVGHRVESLTGAMTLAEVGR